LNRRPAGEFAPPLRNGFLTKNDEQNDAAKQIGNKTPANPENR
jgi:hypothetical protein